MKITKQVCDVCRDVTKDVREYTISSRGDRWTADLCDDDAAPILAVMQYAEPYVRPTTRKRVKATSLEEIERLKQEYLEGK